MEYWELNEDLSDSEAHTFPSQRDPGSTLGQSLTHESLKIVFIKWLGYVFSGISNAAS